MKSSTEADAPKPFNHSLPFVVETITFAVKSFANSICSSSVQPVNAGPLSSVASAKYTLTTFVPLKMLFSTVFAPTSRRFTSLAAPLYSLAPSNADSLIVSALLKSIYSKLYALLKAPLPIYVGTICLPSLRISCIAVAPANAFAGISVLLRFTVLKYLSGSFESYLLYGEVP